MGTQKFTREQLSEALDYTDEQTVVNRYTSLIFGNRNIQSNDVARFLDPGYSDSTADADRTDRRATRDGTLQNLFIIHTEPDGNGDSVVYTVQINSVDTSLVVTMASTDSTGSNIVNTVAVTQGDRLAVRVTKPDGPIVTSPGKVIADFELA